MKVGRRLGQEQEKVKTGAAGPGKITREHIERWNKMTAVRFQTGGETSEKSGLPSEQGKGEERGGREAGSEWGNSVGWKVVLGCCFLFFSLGVLLVLLSVVGVIKLNASPELSKYFRRIKG